MLNARGFAAATLANEKDSHYSQAPMTTPSRQSRLPMPPSATVRAPSGALPSPRRISSEELLPGGAVEIEIEHQQQVYRLRRTALGKLILTK